MALGEAKYNYIKHKCIFLLCVSIIPESPRWLLVVGEEEKADKIIKRIAAINKKTLPPDFHAKHLIVVGTLYHIINSPHYCIYLSTFFCIWRSYCSSSSEK